MVEFVLMMWIRILFVYVWLDILVRDVRMWFVIIVFVKMVGNVRYNDFIFFFLDKILFLNEFFDIIGNFFMCVILLRFVI